MSRVASAAPAWVPAPFDRLTRRELQVATRIAVGVAGPSIAAELGLSPRTVDTHRGNLMQKLGVPSGATRDVQLARLAIRAGLVTCHEEDEYSAPEVTP